MVVAVALTPSEETDCSLVEGLFSLILPDKVGLTSRESSSGPSKLGLFVEVSSRLKNIEDW